MRNNLRQLPALTFSRKPIGNLRGWDLAVERNEEPHLWQSVRAMSEPCVCQCRPQNINSVDENKVRGHYIEEQAATDSFTDILEGVAHGCANHATEGKRFSPHPLL